MLVRADARGQCGPQGCSAQHTGRVRGRGTRDAGRETTASAAALVALVVPAADLQKVLGAQPKLLLKSEEQLRQDAALVSAGRACHRGPGFDPRGRCIDEPSSHAKEALHWRWIGGWRTARRTPQPWCGMAPQVRKALSAAPNVDEIIQTVPVSWCKRLKQDRLELWL